MNTTTNTGLFIILTVFMVLVSSIGGHFINDIPDVSGTSPVLIVSNNASMNTPPPGMGLHEFNLWLASHPSAIITYSQYFWSETKSWISTVPILEWTASGITFMAMMFSFSTPSLSALSVLWYILSAFWLWLLVGVVRGTG